MGGPTSLSFFRVASTITNFAPRTGSRVLNVFLKKTIGNRLYMKRQVRLNRDRLAEVAAMSKVLVIADLNIGDAILIQACISALRDFFPEVRIDYVIGQAAAPLIAGNPEVTNLLPLFLHAPHPLNCDFQRLDSAIHDCDYDVVFNFCPFVGQRWLGKRARSIIDYTYLAGMLVAGNGQSTGVHHIIYCIHRFIHILFRPQMYPGRTRVFGGVELTLSPAAIRKARDFLQVMNLADRQPLHLYNPDASSCFTRLPFAEQLSLLRGLSSLPGAGLLAAGHSLQNIENLLLAHLSRQHRAHWTVVPRTMPIDVFAALVDHCQLYISPDTGQLHLAAARKQSISESHAFANKTAVWGIFGATPGQNYGKDTRSPGFFAANQDAPSRVYAGTPACRNLTCINKAAKTCPQVRCFENLSIASINANARAYLDPVIQPNEQPVALRSVARAI